MLSLMLQIFTLSNAAVNRLSPQDGKSEVITEGQEVDFESDLICQIRFFLDEPSHLNIGCTDGAADFVLFHHFYLPTSCPQG